MNFGSLRVIELSWKIWILFSMGKFVTHFRGHLGPVELVKVLEILVSYFHFWNIFTFISFVSNFSSCSSWENLSTNLGK